MSIEKVKKQIANFLVADNAQVLCIRGNWGTGKTYNWRGSLKYASDNKQVRCEKYAYVSLFGVNSVNDLKQEIIHQSIKVDEIGEPFNFRDPASYIKKSFPSMVKLGRFGVNFLGDNYTSIGVTAMYMLVRNSLICIDDLERKGKDLRIADVLGLVSQLREDRNCKVVVLLNEERLEEEDRSDFHGYFEKVVDISLRFRPTAAESAEVALVAFDGHNELKELVRERTTKLGIDNVRVIRKLYSFALQIEPLLKNYESDVLYSVVSTLVLMGWSHLQPELAPSKEFLVRKRSYLPRNDLVEGNEQAPHEQEWLYLVEEYGYSHADELDLALLRGIQDGYFTEETIDTHATELNNRVRVEEAKGQLRRTWEEFRNTFNDDLHEVLERFRNCIAGNLEFYDFGDVIQVVNLFRDLDQKKSGDDLLDLFLKSQQGIDFNGDVREAMSFGVRVDPDIIEKLQQQAKKLKDKVPVEVLFLMLEGDGYNKEITAPLSELPVEEYVRILKHHKGSNFEAMRRGLTQYNNLKNPDKYNMKIMRNTAEALQRLAKGTPLNAYKVKSWGISYKLASLDKEGYVPHGDAGP